MTTTKAAPTATGAATGSQMTSGASMQHQARRVAHIAMTPVNLARQVLPAKGGVPLYVGLAALATVAVLEWSVAVAGFLGYAGYAMLQSGKTQPPKAPPCRSNQAEPEPTGKESTAQE
ncbi:hypothetical protein ACFY2M_38670 [Streptomyces sp. NPDC001276]|uniref:hypothetical protein n=1 Tax=Streptomyces sp. NPDC001276 TaxID=3364555 RepID=UPI0036AEDDD9